MKTLGKIRFAVFAILLAGCLSNTASAATDSFEVTEATVNGASDYVRASIQDIDDMTVYHKVIFHQIDDYADMLLTVKNNSPNIRTITSITDNNTNPFISYTYSNHDGEELDPGDTFNLAVRITCLDLAHNISEATQQNSVAFTIAYDETVIENEDPEEPVGPVNPEDPENPVEPIEPTGEGETPVPNTGFNTEPESESYKNETPIVPVIAFVSLGLISATIFVLKKKPRIAFVLFMTSLSAIPFITPLRASAEDDIETLNLESTIGLRGEIHLRLSIVLDETNVVQSADNYITFDEVLAAHEMFQQEGAEISPRLFAEMTISDILRNAPYTLDRIEYSNGYDNEEVDIEAMIDDDLFITYYLSSNLTSYNITYDLNGGTVAEPNPTSYNAMSQISLNNPTKEGFVFLGWTLENTEMNPERDVYFRGSEIINAGYEDLHFVANWRQAYKYNITYILDGGTVAEPNPDIYYEDAPYFTLNAPTKEDWAFAGWTISDDDTPKKDLQIGDLTSDITVTAHWKKVYLRFVPSNEWTGASPNVPTERIEIKTAEEYIAPRAYWHDQDLDEWVVHFEAWQDGHYWINCNTDTGIIMHCTTDGFHPGDVIKAAGEMPDNDIYLYAEFTPYIHPIIYDLGEGGYIEGEYQTEYTLFSEFDFPIPKREGYTFVKWEIDGIVDPDVHHRHWDPQVLGIHRGPIHIKAIWEENAKNLAQIEYLQDATYTNCLATPVGTTITLKDKRDEKPYRIRRLADDKCWMVDNLALENYTLTSEDSDIAEGTTFTLPASDPKYYTPYYSYYTMVNILIDPVFGGYYSYNAAVAGTGHTVGARNGEDAEYSICPKGWNLPSGPTDKNGKSDYEQLFNLYSGIEAFTESADGPNMTFSGQYYHAGLLGGGVVGSYWTATTDYHKEAYNFEFSNYEGDTYRMGYYADEREEGSMVRCYLWD